MCLYDNNLFEVFQSGFKNHCKTETAPLKVSNKVDEAHQFVRLESCLSDIKIWMTQNFLMLSNSKTEVIIVAPRELRDNISNSQIS